MVTRSVSFLPVLLTGSDLFSSCFHTLFLDCPIGGQVDATDLGVVEPHRALLPVQGFDLDLRTIHGFRDANVSRGVCA